MGKRKRDKPSRSLRLEDLARERLSKETNSAVDDTELVEVQIASGPEEATIRVTKKTLRRIALIVAALCGWMLGRSDGLGLTLASEQPSCPSGEEQEKP